MKKLLLALLASTMILACGQNASAPPPVDLSTGPGGNIDLNAALISFTTACQGGSAPVWSYSGTSTPGYNAAVDGSVVNGVFHPPVCGSALINTTVTIGGSCTDAAGGSHTVSANVKIGDEITTGIAIVAAQITSNTCGISACWAHTPNNITIPACTSQITIQYYAQIGTTCNNLYYSPSAPPAVAAQTPQCSTAISP